MSDTKFTPGPWLVGEDQCVDEAWSIVTTSGGSIIANVNDRHDRKANARLIAAAPDLYAALDAVESDLSIGAHPHLHIDAIRAAIAKARGEA